MRVRDVITLIGLSLVLALAVVTLIGGRFVEVNHPTTGQLVVFAEDQWRVLDEEKVFQARELLGFFDWIWAPPLTAEAGLYWPTQLVIRDDQNRLWLVAASDFTGHGRTNYLVWERLIRNQ